MAWLRKGAKSKNQHYRHKIGLCSAFGRDERLDGRLAFVALAEERKGVWQEVLDREAELHGSNIEPESLRAPALLPGHFEDVDSS